MGILPGSTTRAGASTGRTARRCATELRGPVNARRAEADDDLEAIVGSWLEYQVDYLGPVEHATADDVARLASLLAKKFGSGTPSGTVAPNVTRLPIRPPEL